MQYEYIFLTKTVKFLIKAITICFIFFISGCLSEEALEATHKNVRNVRLSHTRKISRTKTNNDLMTYLLLSSDPVLSSQRSLNRMKNTAVLGEIEKYILNQNVYVDIDDKIDSSWSEDWWFENSRDDD